MHEARAKTLEVEDRESAAGTKRFLHLQRPSSLDFLDLRSSSFAVITDSRTVPNSPSAVKCWHWLWSRSLET
jgi:hypothetical protein